MQKIIMKNHTSNVTVRQVWQSIFLWHSMSYALIAVVLCILGFYRLKDSKFLKYYGLLAIVVASLISPIIFGSINALIGALIYWILNQNDSISNKNVYCALWGLSQTAISIFLGAVRQPLF
ncbi:hypothetical protein ACOME3_008082 [Neoechinorhynchus agilis]